MKVLVTGGAGYIGSHTVQALLSAGHQVIAFDNLSTGNPEAVHNVSLFHGDITSMKDLNTVMSSTQFDAVIHFAAKTDASESTKNPGPTYYTNVLGSLMLLEAMQQHKINTIIYSSSAEIYGLVESKNISEETKPTPLNPYARSKVVIETALADYHAAYNTSTVILRYFNVAGAEINGSNGEHRKNKVHLVESLFEKFFSKQPLTIQGTDYSTPDGTAIRDYIHIVDVARAHVLALEYAHFEKPFDIFNIGTGIGHSVKEVISLFEKVVETKIEVTKGEKRQDEPSILVSSVDKIKKQLAWNPEYSDLETILQTAYHWEKKVRNRP
jgi:UDP-glucose 4-epimerase